MGNIVFSIFWLLVLIFLAFWVASIFFIPYLIVSVIVPCVPDLKSVADFLMLGITFPYLCSYNMMNGRGLQFSV